jgi:hypothetical protein
VTEPGSANGDSSVSSATLGEPTWSPAHNARSRNAVPGNNTVSPTACSASQGIRSGASRPVNTVMAESARVVTVVMNG